MNHLRHLWARAPRATGQTGDAIWYDPRRTGRTRRLLAMAHSSRGHGLRIIIGRDSKHADYLMKMFVELISKRPRWLRWWRQPRIQVMWGANTVLIEGREFRFRSRHLLGGPQMSGLGNVRYYIDHLALEDAALDWLREVI